MDEPMLHEDGDDVAAASGRATTLAATDPLLPNGGIPAPPGGHLTGAGAVAPRATPGGGTSGSGASASTTSASTTSAPAPASAPAPEPAPAVSLAPTTNKTALELVVAGVSDAGAQQLARKAVVAATVSRLQAVLTGQFGSGDHGSLWRPKLRLRMACHVLLAKAVGALADKKYGDEDAVEEADENDVVFDAIRLLDSASCAATLRLHGEWLSGTKRDARGNAAPTTEDAYIPSQLIMKSNWRI